MKKKTFEEVEKEVEVLGKGNYEVKPPYNGNKVKMEFVHKTCGSHFMMRFNDFKSRYRCHKCSIKHRAKIRTKSHTDFVKQVDDCYGKGEYTVLTSYVNADTRVKVKHNKCGNIYMSRPADLIRGHGCQKCAYITRASKIGVNQRTPLEKVKSSINKILGSQYEVLTKDRDYKGNRQKITIKHLECGEIYKVRYSDIQCHSTGCPNCAHTKVSRGERNILKYLSENGFTKGKDFYYGYTGLNIMDKSKLHLDFYFPDLKLAIEYDGKQHYYPINYFGGQKQFEIIKRHDKIKDNFCRNNKIKLLRISYLNDSFESISSLLKDTLSGFSK